jgi:hypothetical protein
MTKMIAYVLGAIFTIGPLGDVTCLGIEAPHRVHVTVLRRESALRSTTGNRDAYLIRIAPAKGKPFNARMIDEYPGYAEGLPASYIGENVRLSVELRRAPNCDQPSVESVALTDEGGLHCFELVHQSWRSATGQSVDEWWK